jgi:hypothetical protein
MNCGCHTTHALLDLIWWKTTAIRSTNPGRASIPAGSLADDVISPRVRSFIVEIFDKFSNLSVRDLFIAGQTWGSAEHDITLLTLQLFNIVDRLATLGQSVEFDESGALNVVPVDDA